MSNSGRVLECQASELHPRTPPFNPDPNGGGSMFPCPPAMANGSDVPKHMRVSHNTETPALNPNSDKPPAIPEPPTGDDSGHPCPMQHAVFPLQVLQQWEAMWYQRFENLIQKHQAEIYLRSEKSRAEWFELYKKTNQEILNKTAENASLTVVFTPPIFLLLLIDI